MFNRLNFKTMRKIVIAVCMFLFAACANNEILNESLIRLTSQQSDSLLAKYLIVKDSLYALSVSQEEAENQGVAIEDYEAFCELMEEVNATLLDAREQGIPVYGLEPKDEKLSRVPVEYPMYQMPLCNITLMDNVSHTCSFRGSGSIVVIGGSDAPVWSVGFRELPNGSKFVLTGSYGNSTQEREIGYNLIDYNVEWNWEVIKLSGNNSHAFASFWGINCLGIEGTLPNGVVLEVYRCDAGSYSVQLSNKGYSTFRYEFCVGMSPITAPGQLSIGQSMTLYNCAYAAKYTLNIYNTSSTFKLAEVEFHMYARNF